MKKTAMQSLKDQNSLVVDILAGIVGSIMYYSMIGTVSSFQMNMIKPVDAGLLLASRLIADGLYHYFVSKTKGFAGSNEEKLGTAVIMVAILYQQQGQFQQVNIPVKVITYFIAHCVVSKVLSGTFLK